MKSALRQAQRAFDKLMVQKDHRTPHKKSTCLRQAQGSGACRRAGASI